MRTKLGQNFLVNKNVVKKIIQSANLKADDLVLEIGAGKGILTEELAKQAGKVLAVELDRNLVGILKNKFKNKKNVAIVEGDILKFDLISHRSLVINEKAKRTTMTVDRLPLTSYKLIANLPYYITSPIIRKFLESENPPREMILMVQKEVAERICASPSEIPTFSRDAKRISRGKPGKMSILAVSVQYYARPEILFYVGKENFDPVPEVDSAVIKISVNSEQETVNRKKSLDFFRIVRTGFSAKRKMLANNLANGFHLDKGEVENKLVQAGIEKKSRAQELSVEDWKKLCEVW